MADFLPRRSFLAAREDELRRENARVTLNMN